MWPQEVMSNEWKGPCSLCLAVGGAWFPHWTVEVLGCFLGAKVKQLVRAMLGLHPLRSALPDWPPLRASPTLTIPVNQIGLLLSFY